MTERTEAKNAIMKVLYDATTWGDVDPYLAEPLAEACTREAEKAYGERIELLEGILACALADHEGWRQEAIEALLAGHE